VTRVRRPSAARQSAPADDFIDSYVCWREACDDVETAYARWVDCPLPERGAAYKVYLAALDREEQAAIVYEHTAHVLRLCAA
jgi:hypothetical protein